MELSSWRLTEEQNNWWSPSQSLFSSLPFNGALIIFSFTLTYEIELEVNSSHRTSGSLDRGSLEPWVETGRDWDEGLALASITDWHLNIFFFPPLMLSKKKTKTDIYLKNAPPWHRAYQGTPQRRHWRPCSSPASPFTPAIHLKNFFL